MSDLSLQLQQAQSQLPVSAYFDEALYGREMEVLFQRGPRYVGHRLSVPEPGVLHEKLPVLFGHISTISPAAVALSLASVVIIVGLRRFRPHWPGMLIAVAGCAAATWAFNLPVETIGTKFGGIPSSVPLPVLPAFSLAKMQAVLPDAAISPARPIISTTPPSRCSAR